LNTAWQYPRHSFSSDLVRLLLEALCICLVGAFFGVLIHHPLLWRVASGQSLEPSPLSSEARHPGEVFLIPVALEEVRELAAQGGVLVDARAGEVYREGHIAGAVSLPLGAAAKQLPAFRNRVPVTATVIVYCSGYGCRDSQDLGAELVAAGYGEVLVYEGGFPEWRDEGLPTRKGDQP
jgi:rhodanese-related sulfurtransferase